MPAIKYTDRLLIRQIASRTGLTVSSVYKILSGASGFSQSTRERVERMAQELQVRLPTLPASGVFTVGVLIPEHPTYFWSEAISGIRRTVQTLREERGIRVETVFRFVHFPISDSAVEAALEPFQARGAMPISCTLPIALLSFAFSPRFRPESRWCCSMICPKTPIGCGLCGSAP